MKRADRVKELLRLARALDYEKDPNPEHWKTINGAKVHVDKNGKYDGGAGGKFNGDYHFGGTDWKDKKAKIESLANAFNQAVAQKQAQVSSTNQEKKNNNENPVNEAIPNKGNAEEHPTSAEAPFSSPAWKQIEPVLNHPSAQKVPVNRLEKPLSDEEIAKRVAARTHPVGSWGSAAFAYIANKNGFDVPDFRDGVGKLLRSRVFANAIQGLPGVKGQTIMLKGTPALSAAEELLKLPKGKEYHFSLEGRSGIMKNTDDGLKYMELDRDSGYRPGWRPIGKEKIDVAYKLTKQFSVHSDLRHMAGKMADTPLDFFEVDSLKNSKEFEKIVEHLIMAEGHKT